MNEAEYKIAWAAGFVDGEGCFIMQPNTGSDSYTIALDVTQTHPEPLDILASLFGGKVKVRKAPTAAGNVVYIWHMGGVKKITPIIEALLPHLVLKKRQAELILDYCKTVGYNNSGVPYMVHLQRRHIHRRLMQARR